MKKIFLIFILTIVSCSTKSNIVKNENIKKLKIKEKILIINKKDKIENIARFNFYSLNTDLLLKLSELLKTNGIKNELLLNSTFSTSSIEDIQTLAALYGYNKVLVIDTDFKIKSNVNILSLTYLTIVGIFIFPGNSLYTNLDVDINLYDVKTGASLYSNSIKSKSHKYVYRLGNTQSVLKSSISEASISFLNEFNSLLITGVKK